MLSVEDIDVYYGLNRALQGVSLKVGEGEVLALLGRNGAGKTTTLKSIMGLVPPVSGKIVFRGEEITGEQPFAIYRRGIGFVPEDRRIFSTLTVLENLNLVVPRRNARVQWDLDRIFCTFPRLRERVKHKGSELSGGEQQMLTIARTLRGNPDLLLLDEPTEGLAPTIVESIVKTIVEIKNGGLSIIIADQNAHAVLDVVDKFCILEGGTRVYWGDTLSEELVERYLAV